MHEILRALMAVLAGIAAYLTLTVIQKTKERGRDAQVDLEFNTENVAHDFFVLLVGEALLLLGFLAITAGGFQDHHLLITSGETLTLLFFIAPLTVLYRWRRRLL